MKLQYNEEYQCIREKKRERERESNNGKKRKKKKSKLLTCMMHEHLYESY